MSNECVLYTFLQGALGSLTFGAYHQYTTMKIMKKYDKEQDEKIKTELQKIENKFINILQNKQHNIQKRIDF